KSPGPSRQGALPLCPTFILIAAPKTQPSTSIQTASCLSYSTKRRFRTSIANYRETTVGSTGISRCRRFCRLRRRNSALEDLQEESAADKRDPEHIDRINMIDKKNNFPVSASCKSC